MFMRSLMRRYAAGISSFSCVLMAAAAPFALQMQTVAAAPPVPGQPIGQPVRGVHTPPEDPSYTEDDLIETWETIYSVLFDRSLDPENAVLTLELAVTEPGQTTGLNEFGDLFQLDVLSTIEVDVLDMDLTPEELSLAIIQQVTFAYIQATTTTPLGELTLGGFAVARNPTAVEVESVFIPFEIITQQTNGTMDPPTFGLPVPICIPIPLFCNEDPERCAEDCEDDYEEAVEQATNNANEQKELAEIALDTALTIAENNYETDLSQAASDLELDKENCAKISGGLLVAGLLTLWAPPLSIMFSGASTINSITCFTTADTDYQKAVDSAERNLNTDTENANTAYEGTIAQITLILENQLAAAADALEACQEGCYEICGWAMHCILVRILVF